MNYSVRNDTVPPAMAIDLETIRIAFTILYLFLCALGLTGNLWVISVVIYIFRTLKSSVTQKHMYIYILSLCIVDSLVLSVLPLLAVKTLQDQWIFGWVICKIYYTTESINKILSTFILTGLSWDRYMAICHPLRTEFRTEKVALIVVASAAGAVILLLLPCSVYSETMIYMNVTQCHMGLNPNLMIAFISYTFATGFCLPVIFMIFFYSSVLCKICGHVRHMGQTQVPMRKVTLSTLTVVGFYFACWTPYWIGILLFVVSPNPPDLDNPAYYYPMMLGIHALPYANSAFNWIFYALLNKQLRQTHGTAVEMHKQNREQNMKLEDITHMSPCLSHQVLRESSKNSDLASFFTKRVSLLRFKSAGQLFTGGADKETDITECRNNRRTPLRRSGTRELHSEEQLL